MHRPVCTAESTSTPLISVSTHVKKFLSSKYKHYYFNCLEIFSILHRILNIQQKTSCVHQLKIDFGHTNG